MRTKNFIFVLCFVILCSILLIILGPGQNENIESIKNIVSQQIKVRNNYKVMEKFTQNNKY